MKVVGAELRALERVEAVRLAPQPDWLDSGRGRSSFSFQLESTVYQNSHVGLQGHVG